MTTANFAPWWSLCQEPQNDGSANDSSPGEPFITRWGWTSPTWQIARRWCGETDLTLATFNAMTQAGAGVLADAFYWERQLADQMPPGTDISVIDFSWTSGGGVMEIQRQLGFTGSDVDGIIGPLTLARINARGSAFIGECFAWRNAYYDALGFRHEYPGLYRRAQQCFYLATKLAMTPDPAIRKKAWWSRVWDGLEG